jgi:hypothetical protein
VLSDFKSEVLTAKLPGHLIEMTGIEPATELTNKFTAYPLYQSGTFPKNIPNGT